MTQKITFLQGAKKLFLMAACFTLAVVLLGGTRAAASEATVTTDDGSTFTIGYGRKNSYSSYDGPTVIRYTGSKSDVTLPTKVTISGAEQDITILGEAFKDNAAITSVTIPEGYTTIDGEAFSGCSGLTTVTIPGSMNTIWGYVFQDCTKLTTVNFTENASGSLAFKTKAFDGCTALESITLPVQTTSIYDNGNIFTGCTALKNIAVSSGNAKYITDNGSLYAKNNDDGTTLTLCTYVNVPAELTIPATASGLPVTTIGPMAFQNNTTLTAVTIPASVTTIDRLAFNTCSNLTTVVLLCETAPELDSNAFTDLAADSVIYVANETVAAAFTSSNYTAGKTTIQVGNPSDTPATTAASVSLKASETQEKGKVSFDLYLDSATELNVVMFQLTFDAAQVSQGTVTVADSNFTINDYKWETNDGDLTAVLKFGKAGDNLNSTESVKLATITLPLNTGMTGSITATISKAAAAGAGEDVGGQVDAVITAKTASVFIASYDVNSDGTIDLKDIAEAQRYYQAENGDKNWDAAKAADVNGDGKVDLEDYTALFRTVVEAMGW